MLSVFTDNIDIIPGNVFRHGTRRRWSLITEVWVEVLTQPKLAYETVLIC